MCPGCAKAPRQRCRWQKSLSTRWATLRSILFKYRPALALTMLKGKKYPVAAPLGCFRSFAGSTPVLMADGTHRPIEDIEVGNRVVATNPETGEQGEEKVTRVWVHQDDLFEFEVDDDLIVTTEDHPFWSVTDQAWEGIEDLALGEQVLTAVGRTLTVTREVDFSTSERDTAYNLTVSGLHTYHVGKGDVVVHNTGVDNPHLQNLIDAIAHGVGRADAVDGTALAAADYQARTGELVNGVDHLASTAPYRTRLVKMLDGTAEFKPRGGKKQTISLNAKDRAIAQAMVQAIDDAHAGNYKGSWSSCGVGC